MVFAQANSECSCGEEVKEHGKTLFLSTISLSSLFPSSRPCLNQNFILFWLFHACFGLRSQERSKKKKKKGPWG